MNSVIRWFAAGAVLGLLGGHVGGRTSVGDRATETANPPEQATSEQSVGYMYSLPDPRGMSQVGELGVGAVLVRVIGARLEPRSHFVEFAPEGRLEAPAYDLAFGEASIVSRAATTPFWGELLVLDSTRQTYFSNDGRTFLEVPHAGDIGPLREVSTALEERAEFIVLAREHSLHAGTYVVRRVFRELPGAVLVDGLETTIEGIYAWVDDARASLARVRQQSLAEHLTPPHSDDPYDPPRHP